MQNLPELVLENILSYLNNEVCCKNQRELSAIFSSKYLYTFYNKHFKYTFHPFVDISEFKKDLKFCSSKAPSDYRFCLSPNKCNLLTSKEIYKLKDIMSRYKSYKNKDFLIADKFGKSLLNTHSDYKSELDNFIIKMNQLKSNIWFNNDRCCEGCGCEVDIVKSNIWFNNER